MRRLVVRFADGGVTSLDLMEGREENDLLSHMRHFPGREVKAVEEQVYAPALPRKFQYRRREDLEKVLVGTAGRGEGASG